VNHIDDVIACALDPDCPARQCREGEDGHPPIREINAVLGPDKSYLCYRHVREALDRGLMGSSRAAGTPITVWFRVCGSCRPQVDREVGVAA
jgi:hypothetical protein